MDERSIYVAQLHADVDEDLLLELFTQAGPVNKVNIRDVRDSDARFAIVEFEHEESVLFAIEIMNGVKLFGVSLTVKPRNNTKQETIYRQKRAEIERRNHPQSLMASGHRDRGYDNRDRERDGRDSRDRNWDRERGRGNNGSNNRDGRDSSRRNQQNQYDGNRGQWSGNRGMQDHRQFSTPQPSNLLPHQQFINSVLQNTLQYSAPPAFNQRWQHQPPPPPPQHNNHQTPQRRPERHGNDRHPRRDDNWRNNGRF